MNLASIRLINGFPINKSFITTNILSNIGTAKANIGIKILIKVACLNAPSKAIILRINPRKFAPESHKYLGWILIIN